MDVEEWSACNEGATALTSAIVSVRRILFPIVLWFRDSSDRILRFKFPIRSSVPRSGNNTSWGDRVFQLVLTRPLERQQMGWTTCNWGRIQPRHTLLLSVWCNFCGWNNWNSSINYPLLGIDNILSDRPLCSSIHPQLLLLLSSVNWQGIEQVLLIVCSCKPQFPLIRKCMEPKEQELECNNITIDLNCEFVTS